MSALTRRARTPKSTDNTTTGNRSDSDNKASSKAEAKRINVAVTPEIVRALENMIDNEQISLTEAVRRLIGYGDYLYRAVKDDDAEVLIRKGDSMREVVLL